MGDVAHQGDLILIGLETLPVGATAREKRQVADGDSRGSRHIVSGGQVYTVTPEVVACTLNEMKRGFAIEDKFVGPVFTGPCVLEHPQHAHQSFPEGAVVAVVYQRNLDIIEKAERAKD